MNPLFILQKPRFDADIASNGHVQTFLSEATQPEVY